MPTLPRNKNSGSSLSKGPSEMSRSCLSCALLPSYPLSRPSLNEAVLSTKVKMNNDFLEAPGRLRVGRDTIITQAITWRTLKDDEDPKERIFLRLFQILKLVENFATWKYMSKVKHYWWRKCPIYHRRSYVCYLCTLYKCLPTTGTMSAS